MVVLRVEAEAGVGVPKLVPLCIPYELHNAGHDTST
jgi:hypothetical protein